MSRRGRSALMLAVVTAVFFGGLPGAPGRALPGGVPAGAAAAVGARPGAPTAGEGTGIVTLVTGDRVTVHPGGRLSVQAGPGRQGMGFAGQTVRGHHYVIPNDALPLLRSGRVDRRLFDVTALAGLGYDDRAGELPLLVSYPDAKKQSAARSAVGVDGVRVTRELPVVGALAMRVDRQARTRLWGALTAGGPAGSLRAGVQRIWLDGRRSPSLDVTVPQIGAPTAWQAGYDGAGVKVAVLDTGVDATHPDLAGRIAASANFTDDPDADDLIGHGTHVAATIAGTGAASGGRYRGVAPGVSLLNGKVCAERGCSESSLLAGMEWAAKNGAQIVNLSLGGFDEPTVDPVEQAVDDLSARYGTLFVVAAGNYGADASIESPASADSALAVGAVDRDDRLAEFSSRGPRTGDDAIKPELTAPGVDIVAARAARGRPDGPAPAPGYTTMSGTSMATPHVAGAAALLTQRHPDWGWRQRRNALMGSAKPTDGVGVSGQGAGRVDVARAVSQAVTSDTGSVSFGRQPWPHTDDKPVTKAVAYRNTGSAPVTLTLAVTAAAPGGAAAPAGFVALGADTVTVPAGGTAGTTLTVNTAVAGPDGLYGGQVTATAPGGVRVHTPFAVGREAEAYDVALTVTGRDGAPATEHFTGLIDLKTGGVIDASAATHDGSGTLRVPAGSYGVSTLIFGSRSDDDPANDTVTLLAQPKLVVDAARAVRLDARSARPVSITVPDRDAAVCQVALRTQWRAADTEFVGVHLGSSLAGLFTGRVGDATPVPNFTSGVSAVFAKPDGTGGVGNSPYTYDLAWFREGGMADGFVRRLGRRDLATIRTRYARQAEGAHAVVVKFAEPPRPVGLGFGFGIPYDLPFSRTEYVNTDRGMRWSSSMLELLTRDGTTDILAVSGENAARYEAGRDYRRQWNTAVFAPTVAGAPADSAYGWAARTADTVVTGLPLFGDGQGRTGDSLTTAKRVALYRDGVLVGESGGREAEFAVPPEPAAYRLEATAERGAPHILSTKVSSTWTFSSAHVAGEVPQRLPLSSVRFSPPVNEVNTAPAGRVVDVGVVVDRHSDAVAANRALAVQVSFDDGRSWQPVSVRGDGDRRTVVVRHPAAAGFVSLRAEATDAAGNTVTQTVLRAYRIG